MSQTPNWPIGYGYYPAPPAARPASVIAIGAISIALAILGLLGELFMAATLAARGGPPNPLIDAIHAAPSASQWLLGMALVRIVLLLLLLAGSIGILTMRAWARMLLNSWAIIAVLMAVAACGLGVTTIGPAIEATGVSFQMPDVEDKGIAAGIPIIFSCVGYLAAIWAIVILIVVNLPSVRAAFAGRVPPGYPPGPFGLPGYYPPPYIPGYTQSYPPPPGTPPQNPQQPPPQPPYGQ